MKKILLVLLATMLSSAIVSAQDSKKTVRQDKKEQRIQENIKTVSEAFSNNNLTFVPTDIYTNTSGRIVISTYNYLKLQQDYLSADIIYLAYERNSGAGSAGATPTKQFQQLRLSTTVFDITKKEQTETGYMMTINVIANMQTYTITINTNSRNNLTTMSINSTNNPEVLYTGVIREN